MNTNLFDLSFDEDYYKPIITNDAFNSNYNEYESKGDKDKISSMKKYLNMIRPYLGDIINDHKLQGKWKGHSGNTVIDYKTQGEWKFNYQYQLRQEITRLWSNHDKLG